MKPAASKEQTPATKQAVPAKPPVDFHLGLADDDASEGQVEVGDDEFLNTVVIPPNAAALTKNPAANSTDAFIARVKEQLTPAEPASQNGKDSFSSTVPQ